MSYQGSHLRDRREGKGLSRRGVVVLLSGAGMEVTEGTLSRWEDGTTQPRADDLAMLAAILECDVQDFFEPAPKEGALA